MTKYNYPEEFFQLANALISAGKFIDSKGWVPATSGNFSARLGDGSIAITVSGKHKGQLEKSDIMLIDAKGNSLDSKISSAETLLHIQIYQRFSDVNVVLHSHSLNSVLISMCRNKNDKLVSKVVLKNYELLKAFSGVTTHETRLEIPSFANDQNIPNLAKQIDNYMDYHDDVYAYLLAGHGLYTWGSCVDEVLRYLEALDFLFACELQAQRSKNK